MIVKLGPAGVPLSAEKRDTISGIKRVSELKLQAMEIEFVRNVYLTDAASKEVGVAAKNLGIELSVHAPYFVNLCSQEPEKVAATKRRILDSCRSAHYMGANIVVFHPGFYMRLSEEEAFDLVLKNCKEMADFINENGWDVKLGLETTGKLSQFGTLEEIVRICKENKMCVPCIDFAHIFARQGGEIDYGKVFELVKPLGIKHLHTHFSGIEYAVKEKGRGNERKHLPMNSLPDFTGLAKEILKRKLDITIISESPVLERDSLKMHQIFVKLGYSF